MFTLASAATAARYHLDCAMQRMRVACDDSQVLQELYLIHLLRQPFQVAAKGRA